MWGLLLQREFGAAVGAAGLELPVDCDHGKWCEHGRDHDCDHAAEEDADELADNPRLDPVPVGHVREQAPSEHGAYGERQIPDRLAKVH